MTTSKQEIKTALQRFSDGNLAENATRLFKVLGYHSQRTMPLEPNTADGFLTAFSLSDDKNFKSDRALTEEWESVDLLFQLMDEDIGGVEQGEFPRETGEMDNTRFQSYLIFAIKLRASHYNRTQLSQITREINKPLPMPAMVIFQHGDALTFAVIDRRLHKLDASRDVLEKITLIKDIGYTGPRPHPAHVNILFDLSISELHRKHQFANFEELHDAWKKTLDTSELNKRFYSEIANWYFWAVNQVTFPDDAGEDVEVRNATSVIRLITRLIFVWFIKEKGLVPDALFNQREIQDILHNTDPEESTYYKAILQNLFFATLNQEMNTVEKPKIRKFRGENRQHYNITSLYRYRRYFTSAEKALKLFETIPFLNGGLFECLDKPDRNDPKKILRIDGFSDRTDNSLNVPNKLFFSEEQNVDLNAVYGTKGRPYKVRGLIDILDSYKFTVSENTPIEEEVALDPELLGKVFENLLAAYNPETGTSARKQSGSYYTPREIVNYMTDESLIAYLKHKCFAYHESRGPLTSTTPPTQLDLTGRAEPVQTQIDTRGVTLSDEQKDRIEKDLRHLLAYNDEPHRFNEDLIELLINAIDSLKLLDPACGSGAFPMGVLQKLVFILGKLDPGNDRWRKRQIGRVQSTIKTAENIDDSIVRENTIRDLEREIVNINEAFERNQLDYGRKLYLIENCIYGVDIKSIAVQIAKLRFFISLVVDQKMDDLRSNRGVRSLPNLETKFVATDALQDVEKPAQLPIRSPQVVSVEKDLANVRRKHFTARTPKTKSKYRALDADLRAELGALLKRDGFPNETTEKIANWDPYDQNAEADFFDPEWMFGISDGFDVVIGNPPYVQLQKDGGRLGNLYAPCNFDSFIRTGDIYCLFYEKANQLSRNGGNVCFITSNKWLRAGYGKKLRDSLVQNTQPVKLLDMGPEVFDAAVDTNILLMKNVAPEASATIRATTIKSDFDKQSGDIAKYLNNNGVDMELPAKGDPWTILSTVDVSMKRKIMNQGKPLSEYLEGEIYRGIITGLNEAFVVNRATRDNLILEDSSSTEVLKPFLRGRDVRKWQLNFAEQYLIVIESSENRAHPWSDESAVEAEMIFATRYPAIHAHLAPFRNRLMNRQDQGKYFWELRSCKYWNEFERTKIIYPDIYQHQSFTVDKAMFYCGNTCYFIPTKETWLCGFLNSRAAEWFYSLISNSLGAGGLRAFTEKMKQILVPDINPAEKERVSAIVDQILNEKRADADVSVLENEIDQIVYSLYDLTPEEIAIVEENTV